MDRSAASDTMAVILLLVGFYSFCSRYFSGRKIDLDNIELFREYPVKQVQHVSTPVYPTYNTSTQKRKTKNSNIKQPTKKQAAVINTDVKDTFKEDCINALVSLGTKKKEAKLIVQQIFANHAPTTIQEFIKIAYHKP